MITLYTDGSCLGNPGPGGWAFLVVSEIEEEKEGSGKKSKEMKEIAVLKGGSVMTTNNVMELTAAIKALQWLWEDYTKKQWLWNDRDVQEGLFEMSGMDCHASLRFARNDGNVKDTVCNEPVVLITDSNYVKLGITERMVTRKRRQRRRAKGGKLVENVQLWKELDALASCFPNLQWQRTKAHVGTELNERVDQLARMEAGR